MELEFTDLFKKVSKALLESKAQFALAGGVVASLYRTQIRTTSDLDFLLLGKADTNIVATELLKSFGYDVRFVKLHELKQIPMMNKKRAPYLIAVGRNKDSDLGVDFILPDMPWFGSAIKRAQSNLVDFGFGNIPCITIEDMLISKMFAGRSKDIDDIQSIFESNNVIDLIYVTQQMIKLSIKLPRDCMKIAPRALRAISKRI